MLGRLRESACDRGEKGGGLRGAIMIGLRAAIKDGMPDGPGRGESGGQGIALRGILTMGESEGQGSAFRGSLNGEPGGHGSAFRGGLDGGSGGHGGVFGGDRKMGVLVGSSQGRLGIGDEELVSEGGETLGVLALFW